VKFRGYFKTGGSSGGSCEVSPKFNNIIYTFHFCFYYLIRDFITCKISIIYSSRALEPILQQSGYDLI
jgi:hypothetical protein